MTDRNRTESDIFQQEQWPARTTQRIAIPGDSIIAFLLVEAQ
jgi:hypothetical protein